VNRPVIGICGAIERASWGAWTVLANVSPRAYSVAVEAAGGMAVLLPPDDATAERPAQILDLLDGLMLAGGSDIDPASYGAQPHPQTKGTWPERDRFELALGHAALERDMPVLGICRGMELLNVACGGTLVQHLPDAAASGTATRRARSATTRCGSPMGRSLNGRWGRRRARSSRTTTRVWVSWART
jgi:putative glutamine amidotransferase